jgi:hypothetical protein
MWVTLHIKKRKRQESLSMFIGCVAGRICFCFGVGWLNTDRSFRSYIRIPNWASQWPSLVTVDSIDSKKTNIKYINLYINSLLAPVPTLLHLLQKFTLCSSNLLTVVTFVLQKISFVFWYSPTTIFYASVYLISPHVFTSRPFLLLFDHSNVGYYKEPRYAVVSILLLKIYNFFL